MNEPKPLETLRDVLRMAIDGDAGRRDPRQDHFVDDDELLLDWSAGELDGPRHRAVLDHLAECVYCRRELADMIEAGALVLPEASDMEDKVDQKEADGKTPMTVASPRRGGPGAPLNRRFLAAISAVAALLLVGIVWGLFGRTGDSVLAMARRDLDAGRADAAMDRVEQYLDANPSIGLDDRTRAQRLLEESGYRLAAKQLRLGTVEGRRLVLDIDARVARREAATGRIANLRLQAERGMADECSLKAKRSLADYGYDATGRDYAKGGFSIPEINETAKRLEREFADAVRKHPNSIELRLNFGHFLMEKADYPHAADQFAAALRIDPASALAETGLGLALFQQGTDESIERSLPHFRRAVELAPDDPAAERNLAACLARLGRSDSGGTP